MIKQVVQVHLHRDKQSFLLTLAALHFFTVHLLTTKDWTQWTSDIVTALAQHIVKSRASIVSRSFVECSRCNCLRCLWFHSFIDWLFAACDTRTNTFFIWVWCLTKVQHWNTALTIHLLLSLCIVWLPCWRCYLWHWRCYLWHEGKLALQLFLKAPTPPPQPHSFLTPLLTRSQPCSSSWHL